MTSTDVGAPRTISMVSVRSVLVILDASGRGSSFLRDYIVPSDATVLDLKYAVARDERNVDLLDVYRVEIQSETSDDLAPISPTAPLGRTVWVDDRRVSSGLKSFKISSFAVNYLRCRYRYSRPPFRIGITTRWQYREETPLHEDVTTEEVDPLSTFGDLGDDILERRPPTIPASDSVDSVVVRDEKYGNTYDTGSPTPLVNALAEGWAVTVVVIFLRATHRLVECEPVEKGGFQTVYIERKAPIIALRRKLARILEVDVRRCRIVHGDQVPVSWGRPGLYLPESEIECDDAVIPDDEMIPEKDNGFICYHIRRRIPPVEYTDDELKGVAMGKYRWDPPRDQNSPLGERLRSLLGKDTYTDTEIRLIGAGTVHTRRVSSMVLLLRTEDGGGGIVEALHQNRGRFLDTVPDSRSGTVLEIDITTPPFDDFSEDQNKRFLDAWITYAYTGETKEMGFSTLDTFLDDHECCVRWGDYLGIVGPRPTIETLLRDPDIAELVRRRKEK